MLILDSVPRILHSQSHLILCEEAIVIGIPTLQQGSKNDSNFLVHINFSLWMGSLRYNQICQLFAKELESGLTHVEI